MPRVRIFTKLFLSHASVGLLSILVFSLIFYFVMRDTIVSRTTDQLASVNALKRNRVDDYLRQTEASLNFLFTHQFFTEHFNADQVPLTAANFPEEVKAELNAIRKLHDLQDVFVLSSDLSIVYASDSATKPARFGLPDNPELFGSVFTVLDASSSDNSGLPTILYVVPLHAHDAAPLGWLVLEENFSRIQDLLDETTGMGDSGESYLVGADGRMRSASRFLLNHNPLSVMVDIDSAGGSLLPTNDHIVTDYRGVRVISFASKLKSPFLDWTIVSEIDLEQAMMPVNKLRNYLIVITAVVMAFVLVVTGVISNLISRPIRHLKEVIITLSRGIIPQRKTAVKNRDEVGEIAVAVDQLIASMKQTAEFAYAIGAGNFNISYTLLSNEDAMGSALVHMRDQLKSLHETEVRLVREKTAALLEGQENERQRITRELHDGVGQLLTAIRLRLHMIDGHEEVTTDISRLINEVIAEVRRISYNVMPTSLVDFGLEAALRSLCDNVKKYSGLTISLEYFRETTAPVPFDVSIAVFRIAQEGLNNAVKHAGATGVEMHVIERDDEIYLMMKDNGKGFTLHTATSGFGLRSMRDRAMLLNGSFELDTAPGEGTVLELHIPRRQNEKAL